MDKRYDSRPGSSINLTFTTHYEVADDHPALGLWYGPRSAYLDCGLKVLEDESIPGVCLEERCKHQ